MVEGVCSFRFEFEFWLFVIVFTKWVLWLDGFGSWFESFFGTENEGGEMKSGKFESDGEGMVEQNVFVALKSETQI